MSDGDQLHTLVGSAGPLGNLQVGDIVARVLGHGSEDAVSRAKWNGVEGQIPRARGIFDGGYLVPRAADKCGSGIIDMLNCIVRSFLCLVAANLRFQLQVAGGGIEDRLWHQRRARVIEVQNVFAALRFLAYALQVKDHNSSRYCERSSRFCLISSAESSSKGFPPRSCLIFSRISRNRSIASRVIGRYWCCVRLASPGTASPRVCSIYSFSERLFNLEANRIL